MIQKYKYGNEEWVDIDRGTPEEIIDVVNTYNVHPIVAHELTSATRKPRVESHDSYIYCILHFPAFKHTHSEDPNQEVDFIIGKEVLITVRYDDIDSIHKFSKTLEVKEVLEKERRLKPNQGIFVHMLKDLYGGLFDELDYIEDQIDDITKQIFLGRERKMVVAISEMTRTLLDFKYVTDLHRDVLETLIHTGGEMFGENFAENMKVVKLDYLKINETVRNNLEMLRELRETNDSLLSTKQNEVMKQLTVMSFVILPLNLIAWIFAMRTEGMPIVNNPNAFWIVITLMLTSVAITVAYALHKKWI